MSLQELSSEMTRAERLAPFEAFDVLWVALLREANARVEKSEHARLVGLVATLPPDALTQIARTEGMTKLRAVDPPLESVQSSAHERIDPAKTENAFMVARVKAESNPEEAVEAVGEILKRIRNKRSHGFKSSEAGSRDGQILEAATGTLRAICLLLVEGTAPYRKLRR